MIWSGKSFIEFYKSFLNLIKLVSTLTCSSARVRALAVPILLLGCLRASSTLRHRLRAGQTPRVLKIAEFRKESSLYEKPLCSRSNVLDFNRKIQYRDNWDEVFRSIVFLLLDDDLQNAKFNLWFYWAISCCPAVTLFRCQFWKRKCQVCSRFSSESVHLPQRKMRWWLWRHMGSKYFA